MKSVRQSSGEEGGGFIRQRRGLLRGFDRQKLIRRFFGANAAVTILALLLIVWSLLKEGFGFLPVYQWELGIYRKAGLEFCDYIAEPLEEHGVLSSLLNRALMAELATISGPSRERRDAALLAKAHVEDLTALQREALQEALETPGIPESEVSRRRQVLREEALKVIAPEPIPEFFDAADAGKLREELIALDPSAQDLPPFLDGLIREAAVRDAEAREAHAVFVKAAQQFEQAADDIHDLHDGLKEEAVAIKEAAYQQRMAEDARSKLLAAAATAKTAEDRRFFEEDAAAHDTSPVDFEARVAPIVSALPAYQALLPDFRAATSAAVAALPVQTATKEARELLERVREDFPGHLRQLEDSVERMRAWRYDKPIPRVQAAVAFFSGGDWVTNSSWQDFYGVVPLLAGSSLIGITALLIAMPFSLAAAIYTNQFASRREQDIIKPGIEFIQAIPSVVLGFIGIAVLGDLIREISKIPWLAWVPGFPVQERLNMFNAGCLLALMAVPTMFSLSEDALNNVPRSLAEASQALGATRLQTAFRVIVPAALSGMMAAMLLGLGRIIGETMVVLLVAGNRIAIPHFSDGIGAVFQPAHTLTGIIAQELGEVSRGSSHWQALFMVGIVLFSISLAINWLARLVLRRVHAVRL